MRRLVIGGALGVFLLSVVLVACSGSGAGSSGDEARRFQDMWEIDQIEKDFHRATTEKDIDLMMSLYAPNATMTVGPGVTASGLEEIRTFWLEESAPFEAENQWISDHPAYKLEITVNGDRGTLHFECHFVDAETSEVVSATAADFDVARIDGKWLITNMVGGDDRPGSLRSWPRSRSRGSPARGERRIGDPLVRAVARLPVKVRTKLLIAFVGTSLLLVAVGLLGQLVLGQSNDRVASVGPLQERAVEYGQLQAAAEHLRDVLAQNVGRRLQRGLAGRGAARDPRDVLARGGPVRGRRGRRGRGDDGRGSTRVHAASGGPGGPAEDRGHGRSASER